MTVAGDSTHETALVRQILPIFKALRWRGPADAELKFDVRDGQAKILEINPRFSGILHFPIACGVNFPLLYTRAALGERLAEDMQPHYAAGVRYLTRARWIRSLATELRAESGNRLPLLVQEFRRRVARTSGAFDSRAPRSPRPRWDACSLQRGAGAEHRDERRPVMRRAWYLARMLRNERQAPRRIAAHQDRLVRELIERTVDEVPFYRELYAGLDRTSIRALPIYRGCLSSTRASCAKPGRAGDRRAHGGRWSAFALPDRAANRFGSRSMRSMISGARHNTCGPT